MSTYLESDAVLAAKKKTEDHEKNRPAYASRWEQALATSLGKLEGREFSYDMEADPVYASYRQAYTRKGRLAMADTLGKTTALTGGYGNSWAHTAAQESYNGYMQALTEKIPELYALAQEQYDRQTQALRQEYDRYLQLESQDRESFDDTFQRWLEELRLLQDQQAQAEKQDYDRYQDALDRETEEKRWQTEQEWQQREWEAEHPQPGSGSGSSEGSEGSDSSASSGSYGEPKPGYDNGDVSEENIKKIQAALGVTVDGKWGPESYRAAGNVDANTAWSNYCSEFGQG